MPHQLELRAEPRTVLRKRLGALRRSGYVPGNVYGPGMASIPVQVDAKAFEHVAAHATPTTMIDLTIGTEKKPRTVYLRNIQWQFTKREPFHLDFYAVNLQQPMRTAIPVVLHGESPAAKMADHMLLQVAPQLHVEALPAKMPEAIVVDVSSLTDADQTIHVRDVRVPEGVTLLDNPDELLVKVQRVRGAVEEVPAAAAEAPAEEAAEAAAAPEAESAEKSS
jgi:large subunit ribosomal protein L25